MKRRMLLVLALLLGPILQRYDSSRVVYADESATANFFAIYDLTATSVTYFRLIGISGNPFNQPIAGTTPIKTTGSSTTVAAVTASTNPFAETGVGSVLLVARPDGTTDIRTITAKASADSVTVSSAVDWDRTGGFAFRYLVLQSGTTASDGWIDVAGASEVEVVWQVDTLNATSVDLVLKGADAGLNSLEQNVHPGLAGTNANCPGGAFASGYCRYTAAGEATRTKIVVGGKYDKLRVGALLNTDGGAQSITAYVRKTQWR